LRENGFQCNEGTIYYAASKKRVAVPITDSLVERTKFLVSEARKTAQTEKIPTPLVDSNKCPRCSLVGICLPDEVAALSAGENSAGNRYDDVRRLYPARDDVLPVYIQEQGAVVAKKGEELEIRSRTSVLSRIRMMEMSSLSIFGNVQVTTQAIHELCERGIQICYFSQGGWFYGLTSGMSHKNVELRQRQYLTASVPARSLKIARQFVSGKIRNCRTMLKRNNQDASQNALDELSKFSDDALQAGSLDELLGIEGNAGRVYFSQFSGMLKQAEGSEFNFADRNRRPPKDNVNALLSFIYALLAKTVTVTLLKVGFDPFMGFYHQPRYGRPSLALDLMEEFRPIIADSVVIGLINNKELCEKDFVHRAGAVAITPEARKIVIAGFERRLDTLITHPVFKYSLSYRRVLEVQARLLGRHISGEIEEYPAFCTR
jgi:CRISPR-associated protein Cas1